MGSDHHFLLKLKLRSNNPQCLARKNRYNLHLLNNVAINGRFTVEVRNRFQALDDQPETGAEATIQEKWSHIKEAYHAASENILGVKRRRHEEWISLQTLDYIKLRRALKNKISQTRSERQKNRMRIEYAELNKMAKKSARADKRRYLEDLAETAEIAASKNEMRTVYKVTKQICGERRHRNIPVKDKQETF